VPKGDPSVKPNLVRRKEEVAESRSGRIKKNGDGGQLTTSWEGGKSVGDHREKEDESRYGEMTIITCIGFGKKKKLDIVSPSNKGNGERRKEGRMNGPRPRNP